MIQKHWERNDCPGKTETQFELEKTVCLDLYIPDVIRGDGRLRPGILVIPGGGYAMCSVTEAEPIAMQFVARGYVAGVLYYRTQGQGRRRYTEPIFQDVIHDVYWALSQMQDEAEEALMDPEKLGMIGFSAGGHLCAMASFAVQDDRIRGPYNVEKIQAAFTILSYPVILSHGEKMHAGSLQNLWASDAPTNEQILLSDPTSYIDAKSPPTFVWATADDETVPVENALHVASQLAHHNVPFECHIIPSGHHGLALASTYTGSVNTEAQMWITSALNWADKICGWQA